MKKKKKEKPKEWIDEQVTTHIEQIIGKFKEGLRGMNQTLCFN
jgi:hypothetical protein